MTTIDPNQPDWSVIQPGDSLGYYGNSVFDLAIAIKTWTKLAHIETYWGQGLSLASRNGIGVNCYPLRKDGIAVIRRPILPFDRELANHWFETAARGQKYDWKGLLCFTLAVSQGSQDRMFCSEFNTRLYRAGQFHPYNDDWDADRVPPAFIMLPPASVMQTIWCHPSLVI
jgi:hypothetical protein